MEPIVETYAIARRFLANDISLSEFERAFVPLVPYFVESSEPAMAPAAGLVRAIDEALVDFGIGEATEGDVRDTVRRLTAEALIVVYVGAPLYEADSEIPTYTRAVSFEIPTEPLIRIGRPEYLGKTSADTQLAEAHG